MDRYWTDEPEIEEETGTKRRVGRKGAPASKPGRKLNSAPAAGPAPRANPARPSTPGPKQSFESSPDVQRWLEEHALDSDVKPPFEPTLLAGRRDRDWILSSLGHFYQEDLIVDVLHAVKSGKEASVYCCAAHPATGVDLLAAKVYRPRMFRSLSNDAIYRESRTQRDMDGRIERGSRGGRAAGNARATERGRAAAVRAWIDFEWATQRRLHAAGADVPRPYSQLGNAMLMEYVGDAEEPAPQLRQVELAPEEARPLFERLLRNVELFLQCGRIHGDLSAYNVLYWQGQITVIDFAQAVDPRHNPDIFPLLARDVARICDYFAPYGIAADPAAIAIDLWTRYLGGRL